MYTTDHLLTVKILGHLGDDHTESQDHDHALHRLRDEMPSATMSIHTAMSVEVIEHHQPENIVNDPSLLA